METSHNTFHPVISAQDIRQLIKKFSTESPNHIAIQTDQTQFNYQQLENRTGQIAFVINKKLTKGNIVLLAQDKSIDFIASLLACMRLGITFCIFDPPNRPAEKEFLKNGIELTQPHLILTNTHYRNFFANEKMMTECVENMASDLPVIEMFTTVDKQDCAYIAFTSGSSSGKRKGIKLPWEGLYTRIAAHTDDFYIRQGDIVAQHCPITVDAFLFELLIGLTVGATVDLVPAQVKQTAKDLVDYYNKQKISIACFVPSKLKQLKNEQLKLNSVRLLFSVGEDTTTELCDYFTNSTTLLVNGYGPTEATIAASYTLHQKKHSIHLGNTPVHGLTIELRDLNNPAIIINTANTEGEIYLSGTGIALGYIGATDEQSQRFFQQDNKKYYRTGDIGKYDNDRNLVFCYRLGNEGKLLGKFVNTTEVETAIKNCAPDEIQSARIIFQQDKLRSHLILKKELQNPADYFFNIAEQLRSKLADHLLPQFWSFSKEFHTDWKLNLNTYPTYLAQPTVPPLQFNYFTQQLNEMIALWQGILFSDKKDQFQLNYHDNFYLIGGDSLSCTSLSAAFRKKYAVDFPFHLFQQHPTLYFLLRYLYFIHHNEIIVRFNTRSENHTDKNKQTVYLIHALLGDADHTYARLTQALKRSAIGFSSWGLTHAELMPESVEELANSIVEKIKQQQPTGPYYLIGWSFGGIVAHAIAKQLRKENAIVCNIMLDTTCPQAFLAITAKDHSAYVNAVIELTENYIGLAPASYHDNNDINGISDKHKQIENLFDQLLDRTPPYHEKRNSIQVAKANALLTLKYEQQQLAADDFLLVSKEKTVPGLLETHKSHLGWQTSHDQQVFQMPGEHTDMVNLKFEEISNKIDSLLTDFERKLNAKTSDLEIKSQSQQPAEKDNSSQKTVYVKNANQVINLTGGINISGTNSFQGFFVNKQVIKTNTSDNSVKKQQPNLHQ